ncbi:uncharacterized protein LOC144867608 [Branchiostoma floridae x Branchiostoma japonicum]
MAAAPVRLEEPIQADLSCCICLVACSRARVHPTTETVRDDYPQQHSTTRELLPIRAQEPTPVQTQPALFQPMGTPVPGLVQSLPSAPIPDLKVPESMDGATNGIGHHHGNQEHEVQCLQSAPIPAAPVTMSAASAPVPAATSSGDDAIGVTHHHGNQEQAPKDNKDLDVMVQSPQPAPIIGSEEASDLESDDEDEGPPQRGTFNSTNCMAVSEEGEIFVAEKNYRRIQVFTLQGTFIRQFPTVVAGRQKMSPHNVAVDGKGNLWVVGETKVVNNNKMGGLTLSEEWSYKDQHVAVQYDKQGRVLRKFDLQEARCDRGVAVDTRRNHILITQTTWDAQDNQHEEVLVFRPDGTLVKTVGQQQGMKHPWFLTVDGEGNILVSDCENHCVYLYDGEGQFLHKFGGFGSGNGQLISPQGICTDRAGNIIVADMGNSCVKMFDKTGRFLKHITTDLELCGAVAMATQGQLVLTHTYKMYDENPSTIDYYTAIFCVFTPELDKVTTHSVPDTLVAGPKKNETVTPSGRTTIGWTGRRQGKVHIQNPIGVAVSEEGEIFVIEEEKTRIQVFTLQGTFVRQFPAIMSDEEEMFTQDVAMDGEGNLWVVGWTYSAQCAVQYNKQGKVLRKIDLEAGELHVGVAVDTRRNHILITQTTNMDTHGHEVLVFRPDGTLVRTVGQQQGIKDPQSITVDGEGNILVLDGDSRCVYVYNENGQFQFKFGNGEKEKSQEDEDQTQEDEDYFDEDPEEDKREKDDEGQLDSPRGICTDSSGNIIVADGGELYGRVEVWDKTGKFLYRICEDLLVNSQPQAVAMSPQGQLVVADHFNKVTVFDKDMMRPWAWPGRLTFGTKGQQPGQFCYPTGVAVSEEGEIFVADQGNQRIQVFTLQGTFVRQFPTVIEPDDIAIDSEDNLWVVSYAVAVKYDKHGRVLKEIRIGQTVLEMVGVAVDITRNHILITKREDWDTDCEVLVFRPDGTLVRTVGQQQEMTEPRHITVDWEGNILVSDHVNVYVYNEDGQFLFKFGSEGSGEGQLQYPRGICTDRAGNIIVADKGVKIFDKTGRFLKHIGEDMKKLHPWAVAMAPQGQLVLTDVFRNKVTIFQNY